jgi:hypothetical protein
MCAAERGDGPEARSNPAATLFGVESEVFGEESMVSGHPEWQGHEVVQLVAVIRSVEVRRDDF